MLPSKIEELWVKLKELVKVVLVFCIVVVLALVVGVCVVIGGKAIPTLTGALLLWVAFEFIMNRRTRWVVTEIYLRTFSGLINKSAEGEVLGKLTTKKDREPWYSRLMYRLSLIDEEFGNASFISAALQSLEVVRGVERVDDLMVLVSELAAPISDPDQPGLSQRYAAG